MAYTKQNFEDNNILYAQQLNHIEDGIANINTVTNFTSTINEDGDTVLTLTFADGSSKSATISNPVNFKIVGGETQPTSPTENTIWVNTSTAIPSWAFSAEEPGSPVAGMVWFSTGTGSSTPFNALRKNDVHVYPTGAKQYIGGEWVSKEAETFQGGQWADWTLYLYNNGDQCLSVSGGFDAKDVDIATYLGKKPTITYGTSTMTMELIQGSTERAVGGIVYAKNKFDLTGRSAITFKGSSSQQYDSDTTLCVFSSLAGGEAVASVTVRGVDTATLDVSSVTGEMYVGFSIRTSSKTKQSTITVSELLVS